jgi:hypothetical protein
VPTGSLIPFIVSCGSAIASEMFLVSLYCESEMAGDGRARLDANKTPTATLEMPSRAGCLSSKGDHS